MCKRWKQIAGICEGLEQFTNEVAEEAVKRMRLELNLTKEQQDVADYHIRHAIWEVVEIETADVCGKQGEVK